MLHEIWLARKNVKPIKFRVRFIFPRLTSLWKRSIARMLIYTMVNKLLGKSIISLQIMAYEDVWSAFCYSREPHIPDKACCNRWRPEIPIKIASVNLQAFYITQFGNVWLIHLCWINTVISVSYKISHAGLYKCSSCFTRVIQKINLEIEANNLNQIWK